MTMKTFGKQMFWSMVYVTAPLAVLFGGAKWNSLLEADFWMVMADGLLPW